MNTSALSSAAPMRARLAPWLLLPALLALCGCHGLHHVVHGAWYLGCEPHHHHHHHVVVYDYGPRCRR